MSSPSPAEEGEPERGSDTDGAAEEPAAEPEATGSPAAKGGGFNKTKSPTSGGGFNKTASPEPRAEEPEPSGGAEDRDDGAAEPEPEPEPAPEPAPPPEPEPVPPGERDPELIGELRRSVSVRAGLAREPSALPPNAECPPPFAGLPNPSNYCFLNATVQCLRHTPLLTATVCAAAAPSPPPPPSSRMRFSRRANPRGSLLDMFGALLRRMDSGRTVGASEHERAVRRPLNPQPTLFAPAPTRSSYARPSAFAVSTRLLRVSDTGGWCRRRISSRHARPSCRRTSTTPRPCSPMRSGSGSRMRESSSTTCSTSSRR